MDPALDNIRKHAEKCRVEGKQHQYDAQEHKAALGQSGQLWALSVGQKDTTFSLNMASGS